MAGAEFRVVWKREGLRPKKRVYVQRTRAEKFLQLFGPEPWTYLGHQPDDLVCCSGRECGCGGLTYAEYDRSKRAELPKLEWIRVETREVGAWHGAPASEPQARRPA